MAHSADQQATIPWQRRLEALLGVAATAGNTVQVLRNGDEIFPAMLADIRAAQRAVDLLTFIWWQGHIGEDFADALVGRASAGVRVRVLLDALGARRIDRDLVARMRDGGVRVGWFRPISNPRAFRLNHRTHRKALVCDEQVAFTGGVGIADQWLGDARAADEWRDTHFRVTGPAVHGLRAAFLDNWAEIDDGLLADPAYDRFPELSSTGPSPVMVVRGEDAPGWSDITTLVRALLQFAQRRVRIATAYFCPDPTTVELLCATARRGVHVQLLLPGPHADKRFVQLGGERIYTELLDAGVEVFSFQPSMLHAKIMLVDGAVANVGSANFNTRSLALDEEVNLVVFDPAVVGVLEDHFADDLERSEPIDLERWRGRNPVQRAAEAALGAVARFM